MKQHLLLSDSKSERSLTEVKYREPFLLHIGEKLRAFATRQSADSMRLLTGSFPRLSAYFSFLLSHFFAGPWPAFGLASAPSPGVAEKDPGQRRLWSSRFFRREGGRSVAVQNQTASGRLTEIEQLDCTRPGGVDRRERNDTHSGNANTADADGDAERLRPGWFEFFLLG